MKRGGIIFRLFIIKERKYFMGFMLIGAVLALLVVWAVSVQRKLTVMSENTDNAMNQLGLQLSSRFDALTALLDLTKSYDANESRTLAENIKSRRCTITAASAPNDVLNQEKIISDALGKISASAEKHPELKADESYSRCISALDSYDKMVRTSRLIYNNSVTKLNRELRTFPTSLLGGAMGFSQRGYLVEEKADMFGMK